MSGPEGFLERWSRRKQEAAKPEPAEPEPAEPEAAAVPVPPEEAGHEAAAVPAEGAPPAQPEFDLSTLPPIESITAGTDIRAFLSAGVPQHLTRAALRRAWSADPAIRDYIGLSENSWDFNNPAGLHGFGPLTPADDVRRMVSDVFEGAKKIVAETPDEFATAQTTPMERVSAPSATDDDSGAQTDSSDRDMNAGVRDREMESSENQPNEAVRLPEAGSGDAIPVAMQPAAASEPEADPVPRRRHGSALPI
jgi:hypothetical protein